jgi:hypothetical protein
MSYKARLVGAGAVLSVIAAAGVGIKVIEETKQEDLIEASLALRSHGKSEAEIVQTIKGDLVEQEVAMLVSQTKGKYRDERSLRDTHIGFLTTELEAPLVVLDSSAIYCASLAIDRELQQRCIANQANWLTMSFCGDKGQLVGYGARLITTEKQALLYRTALRDVIIDGEQWDSELNLRRWKPCEERI